MLHSSARAFCRGKDSVTLAHSRVSNAMKNSAFLLVTLGLFATAFGQAVRIVYYSDNSCQKILGSTFQGVDHPWNSNMQACTSYIATSNVIQQWMKPTSVLFNQIRFVVWGENTCSAPALPLFPQEKYFTFGQCLNDVSTLPAGASSMIVTYSSASAASVAISLAVALIAFVSL